MGKTYEVQFARQLDGTDNYGNVTHSVKFTTEADSVLWTHQPSTTVEPGTQVFGRIEELTSKAGKPYRKFKREQQDGYSDGNSGAVEKRTVRQRASGSNDDRADGMRQGMCINNAASVVNQLVDRMSITPELWAKEVYAYANALYGLGDLQATPQPIDLQVNETQIDTAQSDTVVPVDDEALDKVTDQSFLNEIDQLFPEVPVTK